MDLTERLLLEHTGTGGGEDKFKSDKVFNLMTSLADYLQDLVLTSSWGGIWRGGQTWRNKLGGPAIQDYKSSEEQEEVMSRKLALCSVIYTFDCGSICDEDVVDRERKTATLQELEDFTQLHFCRMSHSMIGDLVEMVAANIFRSLPRHRLIHMDTEPEEWQDPNWPHLHLVYNIFLAVLEHPDFEPTSLKKVINRKFLINLFALFNSCDISEREVLKTVLHRIYGNFLMLRSFIRLRMSEMLLAVVHEDTDLSGTAQLLEIISAILKGVSLPLREEHMSLIERVLVPLHRTHSYTTFAAQLSHCCCQLVSRQSSLLSLFLHGLLRYWPCTDTAKEILFLDELDQLLDQSPSLPPSLLGPVLRQVAKACSSAHCRVAERALHLCNGDRFLEVLEGVPELVNSVLLPSLLRNLSHHWSPTVICLSRTVRDDIMELEMTRKDDSEVEEEIMKEEESLTEDMDITDQRSSETVRS